MWTLRVADDASPILVDAVGGQRVPPLDEGEAARLADVRFNEAGAPVASQRVEDAVGEYRGKPMPAWRVTFDDSRHTNVYVDAMTGEVTSVRNDTWRRFDFFWMLHIMDYEAREDFHHPLLTIAAVLGMLTALTGLCLAVVVLRPRKRSRRGVRPHSSMP